MHIDDDRRSTPTVEILAIHKSHAWAIDVQDESGGRRIPLGAARVVIGTSRAADVVVQDPTVSARHCALSVLGSGVAIQDLGSKNGTFVGGARVREAWAAAGATITLGRTAVTCAALIDFHEDDELEPALEGVAGASPAMRYVAAQVRRLARHSAPVLIRGESGTGKELVARALHQEGHRKGHPFIVVNVAALPRELVESEMFGHERGAFTGAVARRQGAFADAEGGTLFLDEIGELPLDAQPKLLRALDGYEIRRVGGAGGGKRANVRVVAATLAPLEERVAAGLFRRDLFHRLEVFVVEVPPLRARKGDIGVIARRLLEQMPADVGPRELSPAAVACLVAQDWPGNVRELRNALCRAADLARSARIIDAAQIERAMRAREDAVKVALTPPLARALLREHDDNLSAAARAAGYPRTTFRKLLKA